MKINIVRKNEKDLYEWIDIIEVDNISEKALSNIDPRLVFSEYGLNQVLKNNEKFLVIV